MDRTERLLSLIVSLLDAREPVSAEAIRSWFPEDYGGVSDDAFARKLERDKAELVELGIPLRYVAADDGHDAGYVVDRAQTYLPAIDLDAEQLAALTIAGTGVLTQSEFPYHRDLQRALDKIAMLTEPDRMAGARAAARRVLLNHPVTQHDPALGARLQLVSEAVAASKRLRMVYHTLYSGEIKERTVDPYGLRCWRGRWAVIGYCHERDDVRLFSLHRMRELSVNEDAPGAPDFQVPADFSIAAWQMQPAWRFRVHEPVAVRLEVDTERAWIAEDQLGVPAGASADGWTPFDVEVTNADGLIEWALRQGPSVRVVAPEAMRARVVAALRAVVDRHAGASA